MNSVCPLAIWLPLLIGAQPFPSGYQSYQDRPKQILATEHNGLPDQLFYDSAELLARGNLLGTWRASYVEHNGASRPDVAAGLTMKFTRGRIELLQTGRPTVLVAYNVNIAKVPAGLIWSVPQSESGVMFQDGIYYLEGDTLVICMARTNAPPATQFVTLPGDGRTLFVLQRAR